MDMGFQSRSMKTKFPSSFFKKQDKEETRRTDEHERGLF